jgi:hypothetical protein
MPAGSFFASLAVQPGSQPVSPARLPVSETSSFDFQRILSGFLVVGLEVTLLVVVCGVLYLVTASILFRVVAPRSHSLAEWSEAAGVPRKTLVPQMREERQSWPAAGHG